MLATATVLVDIGRSLREGFFMFWETLWPLVLGFGLSGAVQAFVSRDAMQRRLGNHRAPAVVRGLGLRHGLVLVLLRGLGHGQVALHAKGADYIAAMVFMFASTNLVIELGIVLVVLMGWQFAVSEFVGGIIMIVLLATAGRALVARPPRGAGARAPRGRGRTDPITSTERPRPTEAESRAAVAPGCARAPAGPTAPPTPCPT